MPSETRFDAFVRRIKDNRILLPLLLFGIAVIAIGKFTGAIDSIFNHLTSRPAADLKLLELSVDETRCNYTFEHVRSYVIGANPSPQDVALHLQGIQRLPNHLVIRPRIEGEEALYPKSLADYPVLDIKIRNDGNKRAFLTAIEVDKVAFYPWAGSHVPPSTDDPYVLRVPSEGGGRVSISEKLDPHDDLRFQVRLVNGGTFVGIHTLRLRLLYDGTSGVDMGWLRVDM